MIYFIMPVEVSAEEHTDSLSHQLREVVVTARKPNEDIIPAQVLSGEELHRLNSNSVADALRYFSGVQVKDYGGVGGIKTVNIRSMGTNHTGVVYDGVELGNARTDKSILASFLLTILRHCRFTTVKRAKSYSLRKISDPQAPYI